jgi:hypothetical protein
VRRRLLLLRVAVALVAGIPAARAAFERPALVPAGVALGRAAVAHGDAPTSEDVNPAALEGAGWVALAYANPFGVDGLAEQSVRAGLPVGSVLAVRVAWQRFGNDAHTEDTSAATVRVAGRGLSAGLRGALRARRTEGFSGAQSATMDVGVLWRAGPGLSVGAAAQRLGERDAGPGQMLRVGARTEMSPVSALLADVTRSVAGTNVAVGGEWRPHEWLTLRAGVHDGPWQWAMGFTVRIRGLGLDYALETHPALDPTHLVALVFRGLGPSAP